jgi:nudix-type nucleoside diphosphatase (YffH/AdpP family)
MPSPLQPPRLEVLSITTLLEGWSKVIRVFYRQLRRDGTLQQQDRDLLDRGDGVTTLLHNPARGTVLLLRQPRIVVAMRTNDATGEMLEACSGQLPPGELPLACALREIEEETGHRVTSLKSLGSAYACPGASLEIIHLFLGEYQDAALHAAPGGLQHEGEDIELMEMPLIEAMRLIDSGEIRDARTLLVLERTFRRLRSR